MGWGSVAAALVGVSLALAPIVYAQAIEASKPSINEHRLEAGQIRLTYRAKAGLTPILDADGALHGDMSYFAYEVVATPGERPRPIAFVWNGGPGSNSIPLHYGAFGPKRVAGDALKPNAASLLDVADLVFIDPIEAGFGRFLGEGNMRASVELDAAHFAQFIETWLTVHPAHGEIWLIGESYGAYRAVRFGYGVR
jgi:carboxypeptidase C (cathepsin A)